jgi:hypothetical protein
VITVEASATGQQCVAENAELETLDCNDGRCAEDCEGQWTAWSDCLCDGGTGERTRAFFITTTSFGTGRSCDFADNDQQTEVCYMDIASGAVCSQAVEYPAYCYSCEYGEQADEHWTNGCVCDGFAHPMMGDIDCCVVPVDMQGCQGNGGCPTNPSSDSLADQLAAAVAAADLNYPPKCLTCPDGEACNQCQMAPGEPWNAFCCFLPKECWGHSHCAADGTVGDFAPSAAVPPPPYGCSSAMLADGAQSWAMWMQFSRVELAAPAEGGFYPTVPGCSSRCGKDHIPGLGSVDNEMNYGAEGSDVQIRCLVRPRGTLGSSAQ